MRPSHKSTRADRADARSRCADLDTVADLARRFAALVRHRGTGRLLDAWINHARHAAYLEIRGFAAVAAVVAGLSLPWSSGPVEGQPNHIKTIKRQVYGRAK